MEILLPKKFIETIVSAWGDQGRLWLEELPTVISDCQEKWKLNDLKLLDNLSFNCIISARSENNSSPVILKLSIPSLEFEHETKALKIYNGLGAVKLLRVDLDKGACLMEALVPGRSLKSYFPEQDGEAVKIAAEVMKKLHSCKVSKESNTFPTIEQWLSELDNSNESSLKSWVKKAQPLALRLLETQDKPVLLHGDLHHENILLNGNEWISIDPKGVMGEPAYEVGAFIRNPISDLLTQRDAIDIIRKRFELFSTYLNIDKNRLINWAVVQAVLSACWANQDNSDYRPWVECAQLIERLL